MICIEECLDSIKKLILHDDVVSLNLPVLIGSRALLNILENKISNGNRRKGAYRMYRRANDWDIYIEASHLFSFLNNFKLKSKIQVIKIQHCKPGEMIQVLLKFKQENFEFTVFSQKCFAICQQLYQLVNKMENKNLLSNNGLKMLVAPLDVLYLIKKNVSYFPVKCSKTLQDVHFMERNLNCKMSDCTTECLLFSMAFYKDLQTRYTLRYEKNDWKKDQVVEEISYTVQYIAIMTSSIPFAIVQGIIMPFTLNDFLLQPVQPVPYVTPIFYEPGSYSRKSVVHPRRSCKTNNNVSSYRSSSPCGSYSRQNNTTRKTNNNVSSYKSSSHSRSPCNAYSKKPRRPSFSC